MTILKKLNPENRDAWHPYQMEAGSAGQLHKLLEIFNLQMDSFLFIMMLYF